MSRQREAVEGWQLESDSADAYEAYLASAFLPWADDLIQPGGRHRGEPGFSTSRAEPGSWRGRSRRESASREGSSVST